MASTQPTQKRKTSTYPKPLIIPPLQTHKQTFILLHGRGSNAITFGPPLLATKLSATQTLQSTFPHAQFIFPTASQRRAQIYHRSIINQWFDNWSLQTPNERTQLQVEGLRETSAYIHSLLRCAIEQVGANNVVLGGLSQGCAASLIALLTWEGEPFAAAVGMCGWLPFRKQLEDILVSEDLDDADDDLFETSGGNVQMEAPAQAIAFLIEELNLSVTESSMSFQHVPLFLGHGVDDEKVPVRLGREAVSCLKRMGTCVEWRGYEGLGHWYSSEMLCHLVETVRKVTNWEDTVVVDSQDVRED